MSDRYKRTLEHCFSGQVITIDDDTPHYSDSYNTYNAPELGMLVGISSIGFAVSGTTLEVYAEVSPNQGNSWFKIIDFYNAGSPTPPFYQAFSNISNPGALTRIVVKGTNCSAINGFTCDLWASFYRY
jgi:hypothetical protein